MSYCSQCGNEIYENAKFCTKCGHKVQGLEDEETQEPSMSERTVSATMSPDEAQMPYISEEDVTVIRYNDTNLIAPPIRNGVTGTIGAIWFFGMLFLFGVMGLIWAIIIGVAVFFLLVFGLRTGFFPPEWNIPYFVVDCPKCHFSYSYLMNNQTEVYHPEDNHFYDEVCPNCNNRFIIEYTYTGHYDAQWDKLR